MTDFFTMITARQLAALHQYQVRIVGDVADEPITLAEAWAHLNIDTFGTPPESDHDFWLEFIGIPGSRMYCETYLEKSLAPRALELATNGFPAGAIVLPYGPAQSVDSIKYDDDVIAQAAYDSAYTAAYDAEFLISGDAALADAAGIVAGDAAFAAALEQTLSPTVYLLNVYASPSEIILQPGQVWPVARDAANSVRIAYTAGYSLASDTPQTYPLPQTARIAMLLMLGHLFANREAVNVGNIINAFPLGVHAFLDLTPGGMRTDFA